ncbi:MAG: AAA family ATPase, partial [Synergistaceae bacterium]|nr:AAA family ATPase [Synergistaceae bacterium]
MNKLPKLPIGIQTFEEIRKEGYLYVDKTKHLIDLIDTGKVYFLSRPRRFGKSLTVSTFDALFSGKKELFKGLRAEEFF